MSRYTYCVNRFVHCYVICIFRTNTLCLVGTRNVTNGQCCFWSDCSKV